MFPHKQGGFPDKPSNDAGTPATVVIPCFNEETGIANLARELQRLRCATAGLYDLKFVFVDDGSTDGTWPELQRTFAEHSDCQFIRHVGNRGISSAIRTGIDAAETEIVCSIDSDCTYDPSGLRQMIPLLSDGVDLVTASPYHPAGRVENVPAWRLFLSRGLSHMYRVLLRTKLHTYTSCFRVYRKSSLTAVPWREDGFLGVAELIVLLSQRGATIVEHPETLRVRRFGQSKLRLCCVIAAHVRLLAALLARRLFLPVAHAPHTGTHNRREASLAAFETGPPLSNSSQTPRTCARL